MASVICDEKLETILAEYEICESDLLSENVSIVESSVT
jgi:hypothetical protein